MIRWCRNEACLSDDSVFKEQLQCFRVARLHKVPIMLQDEFDFAITQCTTPDEINDRVGNWNLIEYEEKF